MPKANLEVLSGARVIAEMLQAYGVTHVFFVDAILRRALLEMDNLGIQRVLTHSEKAAAYMADGYSRAARRPGVCLAQSVGAANLAAGLQDAFLGQSSVIALTGRQSPPKQNRNAYQEIPHHNLFADVTKFSARLEAPEQLQGLLRQAFREACSGTPRPSHLDMPSHTGADTENAEILVPVRGDPDFARVPAFRSLAAHEAVARAADAIGKSERPAIVAGIGAVVSGAEQVITELADAIGAAFICATDAKAVMTDEHPLNAGVCGTYSRSCANRLLAEADLVLFLGSDTGDQVTNNWTLPRPGTVIVQMDPDPSEIGRNFVGTIGMQADIRAGVEQLLRAVVSNRRESWRGRIAELVGAWRAEMLPHLRSDALPIRPERLCQELGEALPDDAIVVADTGYSAQWSGTLMPLTSRNQIYLRAAGSLGWAFPAAIGAKCARPDRPVVCFTGDGGFLYHLPELETARRCGINTITVINNNSRLLQGGRTIDQVYGDNPAGHDLYFLRETNFARVAAEFGCLGIRVENPDEFNAAFDQALAAQLPVVIDVVTDPTAHAQLGWTPPM